MRKFAKAIGDRLVIGDGLLYPKSYLLCRTNFCYFYNTSTIPHTFIGVDTSTHFLDVFDAYYKIAISNFQ